MDDYRLQREWKLRIDEIAGEASIQSREERLARETGLSRLTVRACLMRGLDSAEAIERFVSPGMENLSSPLSIQDMQLAIERLARARNSGEHVRVFGDYDVDGTTGAALLSWVLKDHGLKHSVRQPDRFKDGYGLNVEAVVDAHASGATVLLTVDCGITSFEAATQAQKLGLDLIIIDHHQVDPGRGLPVALAVINPQRADCPSGLRQLCGCGLAFYLAIALRARGRTEGWFIGPQGAIAEPNLKQHLDLVVMATSADMVPLTGDNRILVKHGLDVLKQSKKAGVRALLERAGLSSKDISPGHLGFVLGPRINASGRMQTANLALELLTTESEGKAWEMATELERLNQERADIQNKIWDEVRADVEKGIAEGRFQHGIVVAKAHWHEGVVGIVASRVTETFRRPAVVISLREDFGKGSVRSYAGKDVLGALRACSDTLLGFGGHKFAAGLSVAHDQLARFTAAFDEALGKMAEDATLRPLLIEGSCELEELTVRALTELEKLGPFGTGNPEPVFSFRASVQSHRVLKGRHLKLDLDSVEAIWFNAAEREDAMKAVRGDGLSTDGLSGEGLQSERVAPFEWAAVPELNRFRGRVTPTLRVRDFRNLT